ncbi:asparaginase [Patescibacteria group bacterium]|nr:asparaginase [Patescibacteria group bacterium]
MTPKTKKICLLIAGGTILSEKDQAKVEKNSDIQTWLEKMPELSIVAEIEPVFIIGENNDFSGKELWQKIIKEIYERLDSFAGFIVTSRVNNIIYNALAVSFAMVNLNKTVIFTGSQLPVINKESILLKKTFGGLGIKANLINAIQIATMELPVVGLMFGNSFIRAVKAVRSTVYALNIFSSVDNTYLAKIDFGISPQEKVKLPTSKPELKNNFASEVLVIKYYPGFNLDLIKDSLKQSKGLFIEGLAIQTLNKKFIEDLKSLKIPVVVYNNFFIEDLKTKNIIEVSKMTKETALVKFMWVLGQTKDLVKIKELMLEERCAEFIHHK